jgi:tetratricopeptide (TPR) repeat protein
MDRDQLATRLARYPDSPLFARLANELLKAGQATEARALCESGLRAYPDYATAHLIEAKCLAAEKKFRQAVEALKKAEALAPGSALLKEMGMMWEKRSASQPAASAPETAKADAHPEKTYRPPFRPTTTLEFVEGSPSRGERPTPTMGPDPVSNPVSDPASNPVSNPAGISGTIAPPELKPVSPPPVPVEVAGRVATEAPEAKTQPEPPAVPASAPVTEAEVSVTTATVPVIVPEVVAEMVPPALPEIVPSAVAETVPPAVPGVVPPTDVETAPPAVPEVARSAVAETVPPAIPEVVPEILAEVVAQIEQVMEQPAAAVHESGTSISDEGRIVSKTLAEIYATQGAYGEAILTYRLLKRSRPELVPQIDRRIGELQVLADAR